MTSGLCELIFDHPQHLRLLFTTPQKVPWAKISEATLTKYLDFRMIDITLLSDLGMPIYLTLRML